MHIKSCNIRGFGCFTDKQFTFSDGLNCLLEQNGYGKTTLAAFLRVMFYGFKNEGKRSGKEREIRYPWQGLKYGGSIDFELNGKIYRIDRNFGKQAKYDELTVYDLETSLQVTSFQDPIGLQLFGVDDETFERTIYISDTNISTYISDGVHAKIGDLVDDTVDVNRYTKAVESLNGKINSLGDGRKTGKLSQLVNRVTLLEQDVRLLDSIEKGYNIAEKQLKDVTEKNEQILAEQAEIQEKISRIADYKAIEEQIHKHEDLEKAIKKCRDELTDAKNYFTSGMPDEYDLQNAQQAFNRLEARKSVIEDAISQEELDQLQNLELIYNSAVFTDDDQNNLVQISEECQRNRGKLSDLEVTTDRIEKEKILTEDRLKKTSIPMVLSVILLISGIVLSAIGLFQHSIYMIIPGIVVALLGGVIGIVNLRTRKIETEAVKNIADNQNSLETERKKIREQLAKDEAKLSLFFSKFQVEYDCDNSTVDLFRIFNEYKLYQNLNGKRERHRKTIDDRKIEETLVKDFISKYAPNAGFNYGAILRALRTALDRYNDAHRDFCRARDNMSEFEKEVDIESLKSVERPVFNDSLDDLRDKNRELENQKKDNEKLIKECRQNEESARERLENVQDERDELDTLLEQQQELRKQVSIYKKTVELLGRAKESFSLKMTDPVTKRLRLYLSRILGEEDASFRIDVTGKVVLEKNGAIHNIDLMSSGYQALTYFCLRLALADEMYKDDKPLLILDDPFSSLDSDKLRNAKQLLCEAAQEYQILYFTCHESRCV